MILQVSDAKYVSEYRVHLSFNDGSSGEVDLSQSLTGSVYEPLRDVDHFQRFELNGHTLAWPNGADFAPEY
mgnify:CR=1 FL=1